MKFVGQITVKYEILAGITLKQTELKLVKKIYDKSYYIWKKMGLRFDLTNLGRLFLAACKYFVLYCYLTNKFHAKKLWL